MIFFDFDGTLLDSNWIWQDIDNEFLGRSGIHPIPEGYIDYCAHHSFPDAARYTRERYCPHLTEEEIMTAWHSMAQEAYAHKLPLKPGAREVLETLSKAGEPMVLLTSCMPALCAAALENHSLRPYFQDVLTTVELRLEKRDPALYHYAAHRFGAHPGDCTLVDDSPVYCAAAKQAGWRSIGVADDLFANRGEDMASACDLYLNTLREFPF